MSTLLSPLTYLTTDSLAEGVGASQVLPYVERLAGRGVVVLLHSFEKDRPPAETVARLADAGVEWTAHPFGGLGARAGVGRVLRAAAALRGAELVHARSDLSAAAALLAGRRRWLWDVRALWADQRIALGTLRAGSPEERVLRRVERASARRAGAIVTLTEAAIDELEARHGADTRAKTWVVPTCVDLDRFVSAPLPERAETTFLLSGTLNTYYDVPRMISLVRRFRRRRPAVLQVLTPGPSPWDALLANEGATADHATPGEMPRRVAAAHVGLSVCKDAGVSLAAAMPTKIAEFLATGRPVVVNEALGDAAALVRNHDCGVVLEGPEPAHLERAVDELERLLDDPSMPARARGLAETHFDLEQGVDRLLEAYRRAADREG